MGAGFRAKEPPRHHGSDTLRNPASSSPTRGHGDGGELPPQLRRQGEPWREERPRDAEGRGARSRRRLRNHTRLDGHGLVHCQRQGQSRLFLLLLARRRATDVPHGSKKEDHPRRSCRGNRAHRVPKRCRCNRRIACRVQRHWCRDRGPN